MVDLAESLPVSPLGSQRLWAVRRGWRPADVLAWPAVRRFLLVLLALYVAKQGIYVVAFRPFSGHDEVAHYSYLRTVATEGRIPVLPDLREWREAVDANRETEVDQLPTEL